MLRIIFRSVENFKQPNPVSALAQHFGKKGEVEMTESILLAVLA